MPIQPTWEDWLRDLRVCERSMRYFERPRVSLIRRLPERIARENVLGHLKKAYHNLDLANKVFEMHDGELKFRYEGENFFDWVITICYYAMYQASLAALAAVRKEGGDPCCHCMCSHLPLRSQEEEIKGAVPVFFGCDRKACKTECAEAC